MTTRNNFNQSKTNGSGSQAFNSSTPFLGETTKRVGEFIGERAESATKTVGKTLESLASAIHENEPKEGILHTTAETFATKLQEFGRYLEMEGLQGLGSDLTNLIRRNPIPTLLLGVGIGLFLARTVKRS